MSDRPNNWERLPLGDLCYSVEKRDPRKARSKPFKYVEISSVDNKRFVILSSKSYSWNNAPSRARKVIRANDVLFATTRPYLRSVAIVPKELDNQVCSTGFCVLRAKNNILPKWIFYYLRTSKFVQEISSRMRGAAYPAVSDKDVFRVSIPLPALDIQARVIARMDALFMRIEEASRMKESAAIEAGAILSSAMSHYFTKDFETKWGLKRLDECFGRIDSGMTPRKMGNNYVAEDGVPLIQVKHLSTDGTVLLTNDNPKINRNLHAGEMKRSQVSSNAILVNIVGPPLGKIGIIPEGVLDANINQAIVAIREPIECISEYLFYCLRSPRYNSRLVSLGVGIRQANINVSQVREFMIPVPPTSIQTRIATKLNALRTLTGKLRDLEGKTLQGIDRLADGILEKAFSGQLVN